MLKKIDLQKYENSILNLSFNNGRDVTAYLMFDHGCLK